MFKLTKLLLTVLCVCLLCSCGKQDVEYFTPVEGEGLSKFLNDAAQLEQAGTSTLKTAAMETFYHYVEESIVDWPATDLLPDAEIQEQYPELTESALNTPTAYRSVFSNTVCELILIEYSTEEELSSIQTACDEMASRIQSSENFSEEYKEYWRSSKSFTYNEDFAVFVVGACHAEVVELLDSYKY